MPDSALRALRTQGIHPAVTRSGPGTSAWTQMTFTAGGATVRWFSHHTLSGNTVEIHGLPVRRTPRVLNAIGATVDADLVGYGLPDDYEGEAARWLDSETGHALGMVAQSPLPGHEDDALPPLYTSELAANWTGREHAIVDLSGPSMDAVCNLWLSGLTRPAARAVLTACTQSLSAPAPAAPSPPRPLSPAKTPRR
ncbi:hypothetical protein AB0G74_22385 [Streptomyces sp. NPDC020875]|uniref:hypothetical protein n=1 Tax=Streptomyces sp. NPDC020875 TaxID=3154898 RepID=UPI0033F90BCE